MWVKFIAGGDPANLTAGSPIDVQSTDYISGLSGVGEYTHPSLSADGQRLVGTVIDSRQQLERVAVAFGRPVMFEPLTDGYSGDIDPVRSPDGTRLVYGTPRVTRPG